jgi:high affinity sulfate transporter 1
VGLKDYLPITDWFPRYQWPWLKADILAGLALWTVMVPEALAYASIAGVPAIYGLYSVPLPLLLYAVLGTSRCLVVGPDSATALLSAVTIAPLVQAGTGDYITTTALMAALVGTVLLMAGLLKMGWLADFIPLPVMQGFIQGLVWVTILGQLPILLGIEGGQGPFLEKLRVFLLQLPQLDLLTSGLGLGSCALLWGLKRVWPKLPAELLTVIGAMGLVALLHLENSSLALIGTAPTGLPSLTLPVLDWERLQTLVPGALAIALLCYVESLGAAMATAIPGQPDIDGHQELIAYGLANWGATLASGFVVAGSLSKTSVAKAAGAKTQLAAFVHAGLILLTLALLMPLFRLLPHTSLAAVVIMAMLKLVQWQALWRLRRIDTLAFILAMVAFLGVLILGVLAGISLGVSLSLLLLIQRATHPETAILGKLPQEEMYRDIKRHPDAALIPGLLIFRFGSSLIFPNANYFRSQLHQAIFHSPFPVQQVLIDAESINLIDITAVEMLKTVHRELMDKGIRLSFARVRDPVYQLMERDSFVKTLGRQCFYERISEGVLAFLIQTAD